MTRQQFVDVVAVTTGGGEMVSRCVEHLDDAAIASITVVDNASPDRTGELLRDRHPGITVVDVAVDRGAAAARNRGAEVGEAPLILFIDDDIFATPGAVSKLAAAIEEDQRAVAAAGRLVDPDGTTQVAYLPRPLPTTASFAALYAGVPGRWPRNPWTGAHLRRPVPRAVEPVEFAPSAALLIRRSALDAVGGWDEQYWFWWEDTDMCRRLGDHGVVLYVPEAEFRHFGGWTSRRFGDAEVFTRFSHGALRYVSVHLPRPRRLVALGVIAGISGLRSVASARRHPDVARANRAIATAALGIARGRPVPRLQSLLADARVEGTTT